MMRQIVDRVNDKENVLRQVENGFAICYKVCANMFEVIILVVLCMYASVFTIVNEGL